MPREYCGNCDRIRHPGEDDVDRRGYYTCPTCGTRLARANGTRRNRA